MSHVPTPPQETTRSQGLDLALQAFLRAEILALQGQLAERDARIARLYRRLERRTIGRFCSALTALHFRLLMTCRPALARQVKMLEASDYFDAYWYFRRYPQCGSSTFAAIHYLQVGAFQRYDPGPDFSTSAYYQANPDVAATRCPALAHYLLRGRHEGRMLCPLPAQGSAGS